MINPNRYNKSQRFPFSYIYLHLIVKSHYIFQLCKFTDYTPVFSTLGHVGAGARFASTGASRCLPAWGAAERARLKGARERGARRKARGGRSVGPTGRASRATEGARRARWKERGGATKWEQGARDGEPVGVSGVACSRLLGSTHICHASFRAIHILRAAKEWLTYNGSIISHI